MVFLLLPSQRRTDGVTKTKTVDNQRHEGAKHQCRSSRLKHRQVLVSRKDRSTTSTRHRKSWKSCQTKRRKKRITRSRRNGKRRRRRWDQGHHWASCQVAIQQAFAQNPQQSPAVQQMINQQVQQQVQQQLQAQQQGQPQQPQAPAFLVNPALANNDPWPLHESTGLRVYVAIIDPIDPLCDGKEAELDQFLRKIQFRAECHVFTGINVFKIQDASNEERNLFTECGCLTLVEVQAAARLNFANEDRNYQAQELTSKPLQGSLTPRILDRLLHRKDNHTVNIAVGPQPQQNQQNQQPPAPVLKVSGTCQVFELIMMIRVHTKATVASLLHWWYRVRVDEKTNKTCSLDMWRDSKSVTENVTRQLQRDHDSSVACVPDTTIAFSGNRKILRIPPCNASGTYLERSVPAIGLNIPTQNSTSMKLAIITVK